MHVKPAPGLKVPDPERGGLLADEGREVDDTSTYWTRRVDDGDVVVVSPPPAKAGKNTA